MRLIKTLILRTLIWRNQKLYSKQLTAFDTFLVKTSTTQYPGLQHAEMKKLKADMAETTYRLVSYRYELEKLKGK